MCVLNCIKNFFFNILMIIHFLFKLIIVKNTNCTLNVRYSCYFSYKNNLLKNSLPSNFEFEDLKKHFDQSSFPNVHKIVKVEIRIQILSSTRTKLIYSMKQETKFDLILMTGEYATKYNLYYIQYNIRTYIQTILTTKSLLFSYFGYIL